MTADDLTLAEAADVLGVHYMTVYRYVRTGRLAATRRGAEYRVRRRDVAALGARARPSRRNETRAASETRRRLETRLLAGDEPGAWQIVDDALAASATPHDIYLRLLVPALSSIGRRWEGGRIRVDDEHRATAVALRLIGRLGPRFRPRGPRRGTIVVGAAPGDHHSLPVAIAADLLRSAGFDVVDLGGDVPAAAFAACIAAADRPLAVVMSVATPVAADVVRDVVEVVSATNDIPVIVGGPACDPHVAAAAGATVARLDDLLAKIAIATEVQRAPVSDAPRRAARRSPPRAPR